MVRVTQFVLFLCVVLLLSGGVASAEELKVVGSWGKLSMYKNFEQPFWQETLPAAFPGLSADLSSLGQISVTGPEVLHRLAKGEYDVVHTCADYVAPDSLSLEGLNLPMLAPSMKQAVNVSEAYRPVVEQALAKDYNAKLLAITPYPGHALFCSEKITGLDDLKGKKVRIGGGTKAEFIRAIGAIPVSVPFNKAYEKLQSGAIDCVDTGTLSGYTAGLGKVAKYVYPLLIGGWNHVLTSMNMDRWKTFSPEDQARLQELFLAKLEKPIWEATSKETKDGLACLTGGSCPYGEADNISLVALSMTDLVSARMILTKEILPAWGKKIGPDAAARWNATAGKKANIQIQ